MAEPEVPCVTTATSLADELRKLADLRKEGILTEAEFEAAKSRVIAIIPPHILNSIVVNSGPRR